MKKLYLLHVLLTLSGASLLFFAQDLRSASSFAAGSLLILANVSLMSWLWGRIMQKKLVALSLLVIVFKYAILGVILYQILKSAWLMPGWFCAGIGMLMLSATGASLFSETDSAASDANPATGSSL